MKHFDTAPAPHLPPSRSVRAVMAWVLLALLPVVLAHGAWFGPGIFLQIALASGVALLLEAMMLRLRGRPLRPCLTDLSAPLAATLFALSIPPLAPWWIAAIGMIAAMVFAKHLYGGLGQNLFNPAMVGVAVVVLCFPRDYAHWLPPAGMGNALPGWSASLRAIAFGELPAPWHWDALAQATPLDSLRQLSRAGQPVDGWLTSAGVGAVGVPGWEWLLGATLLGGAVLLWQGIIRWQTPAGVIAGVLLIGLPLWWLDPTLHLPPWSHLVSGGVMLAAFFIATDPVTGCSTPRGRLLFGIGVGALTLLIRRWGSYPDGVAFAILLMNCIAPWLDRYTRPRYYGERQP